MHVTNPRPSSPGSLSDLIERGMASEWPSTRSRAQKLLEAVRALRNALAADQHRGVSR